MPVASVGQRMRKLQQRLIAIRLGPGAVLLPKDIKKIHLRFAPKINGGHMGPRQFWRNELVRLQYHNPAVVMTVDNKALQEERAILSVHFVDSNAPQTSDSSTSAPAATDSTTTTSKPSVAPSSTRVETIDMTDQTNDQILTKFITLTRATTVEPTEDDLRMVRQEAELRVQSEKDSKLMLAHQTKIRREKELLEQARAETAAM